MAYYNMLIWKEHQNGSMMNAVALTNDVFCYGILMV
jgi:hypothetical protein